MENNAPRTMTVSDLNSRVKAAIEQSLGSVWIEGELSDISKPRSGHIYLTLKDRFSQVRAVIWRSTVERLKFELEDGQHVVCEGYVDVYKPRGVYQLIIRQAEPQGLGRLQLALQQLQRKLAAEGLFDDRLKRSLPSFPRRIAFVTSPTGAAVRDFLEVVRRRWAGVEVLVVPSRVQGECAGGEIARAIERVNSLRPRPDVLIVGRGGGSLEDLWCFNDERVVRAIRASAIPVVSAVGHEIDVTLADLAADLRALTPSEAAERVVPSAVELTTAVGKFRDRLTSQLRARFEHARTRLESLENRPVLRQPFQRLRDLARKIDDLDDQAGRAIGQVVRRESERIGALAGRLESLSPLNVLARGYSLTQLAESGKLAVSSRDFVVGDTIATTLHDGSCISRIEAIEPAEPDA